MLQFVLRKLINKKWMAVCLLIGNLLIVAVAASNPTYSDAILQKTLTRGLANYLTENNDYPGEITIRGAVSDIMATKENRAEHFAVVEEARTLPEKIQVPAKLTQEEFFVKLPNSRLLRNGLPSEDKTQLSMGWLEDIRSHTVLLMGGYPADTVTEDGVIEAMISQQLNSKMNLMLNDYYELPDIRQADGETPYRVKIVGIFDASASDDLYWRQNGSMLSGNLIISEKVFEEVFVAGDSYPCGLSHRYTVYLDYTEIKPDQVHTIMEVLSDFKLRHDHMKYTRVTENLVEQLKLYLPEETRLTGTLTVLQAPLFVLLAAFIFMVSRQMMAMEENEIAVIKSRGSMVGQIIQIYVLQALILGGAGLILGYPVSYLMCGLLGSSNAFLEFVQREALPIRFVWKAPVFAAAACFAACCFMTVPVLHYTKVSIVQHKVKKQTGGQRPLWQRCFLDLLLLAVSVYALYSFDKQKSFLALRMAEGEALDPLLYFSSSLFILGAGLLGIRILPMLIRLVFRIGKKAWTPSVYTSFLRVVRTGSSQGFIMVFIILTISMGIFNMTTARSVNGNAEAQTIYLDGADVVLKEQWETADGFRTGQAQNQQPAETDRHITEPDFEKYRNIPGVTALTKVYMTNRASLPASQNHGGVSTVTLMGINTREFGQTANFDTSLLPHHWYYYLNAISQDPAGVLLSSSFRDQLGYSEGDVITYRDNNTDMKGTVYGFVDYWPGYAPSVRGKTDDGKITNITNYLIVTGLSGLQAQEGIHPYQIWMKMEDSTQPVYDFIAQSGARFSEFRDTAADLIALKNQPVLQGTNGVLTSNFIIVLLLCMVGFLIFWILSIHSRELQFGIFRAMGMSFREIINMLVCEQILISGSSILIGVGVGALVTELYLPLIQLAYSADRQVLPVEVVTRASDAVRLAVVIVVMIGCCMAILAWLISKIKIAQALKLGED